MKKMNGVGFDKLPEEMFSKEEKIISMYHS